MGIGIAVMIFRTSGLITLTSMTNGPFGLLVVNVVTSQAKLAAVSVSLFSHKAIVELGQIPVQFETPVHV
jgi:hypothetical protein